ncbi:class I SAM-dependent methyltransferase [Pseudonocardia sp. GCM10023141]|uniref:class I SAM-dependent methyltransferase n=1 Tax=Pseudonocardia sp. GCM10023141 TaxID=3252653 RepID=UPI003608BCEC
MTTLTEHRTFLRSALNRPTLLGAPVPTGSVLAAQIAGVVPASAPATVVELGAGTGALSPAIAARLAPGSRFVAVEVEPDLVAYLRAAMPWLEVLHGDAGDIGALLADAGVGPVDAVVSSLPWTLITAAERRRMLGGIAATLAPGGLFTTITTLTALPNRVRQFRSELEATFDEVTATKPVWRNLPPARLFVCRGARSC